MFPIVTYNEGSGYSYSTGKFTAPVSGVYAFTKLICTSAQAAFTAFVHNTQHVLGSISKSPTFDLCSSTQVFVHMSKGDQLWVKSTDTTYFYYGYPKYETSFSGALMHT